tara:strand:- start:541 stop:2274 length:1734 start_codon:yes stop_codon:yes gene_type:complete
MSQLQIDALAAYKLLEFMARAVPPDQYLREFVQNAIDALQRGMKADDRGKIRISKDKQYPNKIVISNSTPADPFTKKIVSENLLTLAQSGHNQATNHGSGSKLAYLPGNNMGILFRSRAMMLAWQMWVNPETSAVELRVFELEGDDSSDVEEAIYLPLEEDEFTFEDSETEVVLLGNDDAEDTWLKATQDVGRNKQAAAAGYVLLDYLNHKYWDIPDSIDLIVQIYAQEGNETELRYVHGLKDLKNKQDVKGSIPLSNGMIIHYYALKSARGKKSAHSLAGTVGFLHENEIFRQRALTKSAIKKLMMEAGIYVRHTDVMLLIEVPSVLGWQQTIERTQLTKNGDKITSNLSDYLEEFRSKFPQDLRDWMETHAPKVNSNVEVRAQKLMTRMAGSKKVKNKVKASSGKNTGTGPNSSGSRTPQNNTPNNKPPPPPAPPKKRKKRKKRKPQSQVGNTSASAPTPPTFRVVKDGAEDPTIQWDPTGYAIGINVTSSLFENELGATTQGESFPGKLAETFTAEEIYILAVRYISKLQITFPSKSSDLWEEKLKDDKLDALVTGHNPAATRLRIKQRLQRAP